MTTVTQFEPQKIGDIETLYRECGYGVGRSEEDVIFTARFSWVASISGSMRVNSQRMYLA